MASAAVVRIGEGDRDFVGIDLQAEGAGRGGGVGGFSVCAYIIVYPPRRSRLHRHPVADRRSSYYYLGYVRRCILSLHYESV